MDSTSDNDKLAMARRAQAVMGLCKPVIDELIATKLVLMAREYRGRTANFEFLLGKIAEIVALQDLEHHLERVYRQGTMEAIRIRGDEQRYS